MASHTTRFPVRVLVEGYDDIRLVITSQVFSGDDWPRLTCDTCDGMFPFTDLLRMSSCEGETALRFEQGSNCHRCVPHERIDVQLQPRMKVTCGPIRGDDGNPLRWLDEKKKRRLSVEKLQFRFMDKKERPLILRLQPYKDRKRAKDGTKYAG